MIPYEAKNQFQDIITNEMVEMRRKLARALQATERSMFSRGLGQSGNAMLALAEHATNSLKARAHYIFDQLQRCLSSHHVALSPEVLTEALTLLRTAIEDQAQLVEGQLFESPSFCSVDYGLAKQRLQSQYRDEGPRLIARLSTELKLAAAAANGSPNQSVPSFTFHGPESREFIGKAKAEAEKPEGNTLKLRSVLRTITDKLRSVLRTITETTKFVESLELAYRVLKSLLSYLGIHLP